MRKTFKNKKEVVRKGQHQNESARKGQNKEECGSVGISTSSKNRERIDICIGEDSGSLRSVGTSTSSRARRGTDICIGEGSNKVPDVRMSKGCKGKSNACMGKGLGGQDSVCMDSDLEVSSDCTTSTRSTAIDKPINFVKHKIHDRYNYLEQNALLYVVRNGQNRDTVDNLKGVTSVLIDKIDLKNWCRTIHYVDWASGYEGCVSHLSAQIKEILFSAFTRSTKRREDIASSMSDISFDEQRKQFDYSIRARCSNELMAQGAIHEASNIMGRWKALRSKCEDGELIYFVNPLLVAKFKEILVCEFVNLRGIKYHLSKLGPFPAVFTREIGQIEGFTFDEMLWIAFIFENSCVMSTSGNYRSDVFRNAFSQALADDMPNVEDVLCKIRGNRIEHFMALVQYSCEPVLTTMVRPDNEPTLISQSDVKDIPPSADEGAVGVQAHQEMNTAIESTVEDKVADFVEKGPTGDLAKEFEDYPNQPQVLTSRFVEFFNFNLTTSAARGQILAAIQLPDRLIAANDRAPNALMFKQYEWYRSGIDLKVQTNCSKLQQFAIFAAVIYGANDRDSVGDLLNLNTLSTMPCMVINGSFSTSMEMHVPFIHGQHMVPIGSNTQMRNINFATLVLVVASPLSVATGTPPNVNIRLFGAFKDASYYGLRGYYQPYAPVPCVPLSTQGDMLKAAAAKILINNIAQPIVSELSSKVSSFVSDSEKIVLEAMQNINRDKPIEMRRNLMIQTSGQDMSAGLGKCLATPMRLNPFGTTPHPVSEIGVDQKFSIDAIKQVFGLVGIFQWGTTSVIGTRLFSTTVQLGPPTMTGNVLNTKNMSPVDHLSSMFATYRGSLKYKFMFVTNGIATGRVRVCYEPGVSRTSNCDVDTIPFAIFDLGADLSSNTVFEFVVPYQYMQHQFLMKPTLEPLGNSGYIHSGVLSVFVEIPLVAAAIVPGTIEVLVYKAGDSNIEFGVPRNNLTAFAAAIEDDPQPPPPPPDEPIEPGPPPPPPPNFLVSRQGIRTVQVNRNSPFVLAELVFLPATTTQLRPAGETLQFRLTPNTQWTTVSGSVIVSPTMPLDFWFSSLSGSVYIFTCAVGTKVIDRFQRNVGNRLLFELDGVSANVLPLWTVDVSNFDNDELPVPLFAGIDTKSMQYTVPIGAIRPDGDPRLEDAPKVERPCPSGQQIMPVANGEKQDNLYDNLRRMEKWMTYRIEVHPEFVSDAYHVKIPASFGAPCYRNQTDIWMRTNKITFIADMFRFARGGVRYTFIVNSSIPNALSSTTMEVVHVPFAPPEFDRNNQVGTFSLQSMGYAVQVFSLQQNNINTVEIPHYNLGSCNYNSSFLSNVVNIQRMNSLGTIFVRFSGPEQVLNLEVFRALADDTRFYVFNGTPERALLGSSISAPYYSGGARPPVAPANQFVKDLTTEGIEPNPGPILSKVRPDGLFSKIVGKKRLDRVDSIITTVDTNMPKMQEALEKVNNIFDDVSHAATYIKITDITTQILHVINCPKFSTFLLSLTSIICKVHPSIIGHGISQITGDALDMAKRLWRSTIGSVRPDGVMDEIWQFVCALGGTKYDAPKGIGQKIAASLRCATMTEKIVSLFKAIFVTLRAYAVRVMRMINPDWLFSKTVLSEDLDTCCVDFLEAAPIVCSPDNFLVIRSDPELAKKVLWLQQTGFMLEGILNRVNSKHQYAIPVKMWNNKLMSLIKDIIQNANAPYTRYEPFVLYLTSSPGMGKSFESDKIIQELLRNLNVKVTSNAVYSRAPASEYWDGYHENTLVVKYDDFAVTKDERGMLELTELIHLKTSATYIGNFSEIHEKQKNIDPMIVVCCSNVANPQHSDINDLNAVWRRRDVLAQFKLSNDFKKCDDCNSRHHLAMTRGMACQSCRELNVELIADERHIRVNELDPLTGEVKGAGLALGEWKRRLVDRHKFYHERELENVKNRLSKLADITMQTQDYGTPGFAPIKGDEALVEQTLKKFANKFDAYATIACSNSHKIVRDYWVSTRGLPSDPPPWYRVKQGCANVMDTMRLKSSKAFNQMENLCLRAFNLSGSYDVTKAEDKVIDDVLKDLGVFETPSSSTRPDGLGQYLAATAVSSIAGYALGATIPLLVRKRYKCSHTLTEEQSSRLELSNGFAVLDGRKYMLECDDCFVNNMFRLRTAVEDFLPCVCNMPVPKNTIRMGTYLWADNFVYTSSCNACLKKDACRYTHGEVVRQRYNLHCDKATRDKQQSQNTKKAAMWHAIFCGFGLVISMISTYMHFKMYAAGDDIHDDGVRPDSFSEKEFAKPKKAASRRRMVRGDAGAFDIVPFIEKHCAYLTLGEGTIRVLRIGGSKAITTLHQANAMLQYDNVELTLHDSTKIPLRVSDIIMKPVNYEDGVTCDLAVLTFPKRVPEASSLLPHFIDDAKLDDRSTSVTLYKSFTTNRVVVNVKVKDDARNLEYLDNCMLQGLSYSARSFGTDDSYYLGACGTIAIDNVCGKIVGMHVASETYGSDKSGLIQFITKEFISDELSDEILPVVDVDGSSAIGEVYLATEDSIKVDYNQEINVKKKDSILTPLTNVSVIGSLATPLYQIAYSSIKLSPMNGVLSEPLKKPVSFITAGEEWPGSIAMQKAIEKNEPCVNFGGKAYNRAKEEIKDYLICKLDPTTVVHSIRTADEAINGNENVPHFIPMDMSTSPGYPDKVKHTQKKTLFKEIGGKKVMCDDLDNRHSKNMLTRFVGLKPTTIYACSLKDERLVEGKAPRLIQGAPVEFIVASRRLTMDFASAFYTNKLKAFSAVGMNCMGDDWQELHKKLKWKNNIMAGDIKSFGPTLDQSVVAMAYDIINSWYKQHTTTLELEQICKKARKALMSEVLNSWNVAYDTVFQTMCCSPSGQPLTVIINTLCLIIYIYTCWLDVMYETRPDLADIRSFLEHCVMFAYGDDFIMSVNPEISDIWNNQVLQNKLAKYGVKYTGIDKKDVVKKFECLEQTTFLGRKFTYVDGCPAGALDIAVIKDVPNWIHKRHLKDPDSVQYSMTVGLLQEFVFHGKKEFDNAHEKLRQYWLKRGKPLVSCDWETLHERWRRNELKEAFPEVYYPLDI